MPNAILLEPFGRNTAPAITVAALKAKEIEENSIQILDLYTRIQGQWIKFRSISRYSVIFWHHLAISSIWFTVAHWFQIWRLEQ